MIGLNVLLYPKMSNYINEKNQTRAIDTYIDAVSTMDYQDYSAILQAAQEYNVRLAAGSTTVKDAFAAGQEDNDTRTGTYWSLLNVDNDGAMGYVEIDKINVRLPIYHGTGDDVLSDGVGHLQGSSLPVGGAGTHAVLSAHTGMPSAELFTDIDQLQLGDTFAIKVLGDTLTYQVDQILTVLPSDVDALSIVPGQDYVTLVTCTPYGINTHRLLIRGTRIQNPVGETSETTISQNSETQKNQTGLQRFGHKLFVGFSGVFEATITLFVRVSERIMDLFGVAY
ncbi:MAG: class C sortase [Oscillospiraceae bacterium]|nr:class C sortase [Oscillospiraceae bacterium]